MTVSAHDVARELRRRLPQAGAVKIQKLLYYCQGWHLTWAGERLFGETIEAWANGPVVATLWADEKYDRGTPTPTELTEQQARTLDYVVGRYGRFSGKELIRQTHLEDPWRQASESEDTWDVRSPEITTEALQAWFEQDDDFAAHQKAVVLLRERTDVFSFAPPSGDADLNEAVVRALNGERIRHSRPA